jgi:PAS domain S-box-containing protein
MDDPSILQEILGQIGLTSTRAVAAVKPVFVDGVFVDGTVLWITDKVLDFNPRVVPGITLLELWGDRCATHPTTITANLALQQPGVPLRQPTVTREVNGRDRTYAGTVTITESLLIVEYEDLTDIVTREQAAEASEHNFRALLDGLDAGVVLLRPILDADGSFSDAEITWTNVASRRMWLNQEGLKVGTRVAPVYYDLDDWLLAARSAWNGQPTVRMLTVDPSVAPWTSATEMLRRVGDTLVELTIDRTQDKVLLDSLAEADYRFASLIDDLPLTVVVAHDGEDHLEFVSPNAASLMGRTLHELRSFSTWVASVHPDDAATARVITRNVTQKGHHEGTLRLLRADGSDFVASLRLARRVSPTGREGYIGIIADISDQQRLIDRLASGERLETLGRTAGSIAHDFNNLLMIVSGNIERARGQVGESIALDTAQVASQRAAELATSLLSFARGRQGSPRRLHIDQFLRNFEPILHGVTHPRAALDREYADQQLVVVADESHLQQIVLNLVTNARDASPAGGTVRVAARLADRAYCHLLDQPPRAPHVAISVSDQGDGVPPHIASRIWEPFFSGRELTDRSGTGLGLSTVHGLAHQYGGHVQLETVPGKGTTFTVYLPLATTE